MNSQGNMAGCKGIDGLFVLALNNEDINRLWVMSGTFERAKTLTEASLACDVQELEGETLERYYVALESRRDAIAEVNTVLEDQTPGQFSKLLFTGHVGCGKSSELSKIAQDEQERFQIIFLKIHEQLRIGDLEYTNLYLIFNSTNRRNLTHPRLITRSNFTKRVCRLVQRSCGGNRKNT